MRSGESARPDVGVIALVPNRWTDPWMPRHQLLGRIASHFPVAWIDPSPHWRDVLAQPQRFRVRHRQAAPGLTEIAHAAPTFHRLEWLRGAALGVRLRRARRLLRRRGAESIVLYLWRPEYEPALGLVDHDLSCYHIDDEYTFSAEDLPVSQREERLLRAVDHVFIHSDELIRKKGALNPNTTRVPNGVDYAAFATPSPEPADLAGIPHPRIGYAGWLKRQLDWTLLRTLAERHPTWSFVFVGPRKAHVEIDEPMRALERLPNVHFLGRKSVAALAHYPQHFDVCVMPYALDGYTRYIYPLKLHEYLASGRPVVGSPVPALEMFADVVALPRDAQEWSHALAEALTPGLNGAAVRAARQRVAAAHDWAPLARRVAQTMAFRLGGRAGAHFATVEEGSPMIEHAGGLVVHGGGA